VQKISRKWIEPCDALCAAGVVLVGLHFAKTFVFIAVGQPPFEGDALHYWSDAQLMVSGDWLMARNVVETVRTPGYPLLLALFQLAFGHHALIAAVVCQQFMVFADAMLAAWMCARVSGTRLGGVLGLMLGLLCCSQNSVATCLVSDTLFTLLLTLAVATQIAWCERPVAAKAVVVGFLLGLATLVRPIAQFAWGPVLLAMAFRWRTSHLLRGERPRVRDLKLRQLLAHGACLLGMFAAVLAPWCARNYYYCGQVFLSKTTGITVWQSLFKNDNRLDPPVPFADGPKTASLLARLGGVDLTKHYDVIKALERQGMTRMEANDRMQEVCLEAIRGYPWKFIESRLRRFAWFWITPNGTRRPGTREFHGVDIPPDDTLPPGHARPPEEYGGLVHWRWEGYYRDGKLNWLWHPNPLLYAATAALAGCGVIAMFFDRSRRPVAVALGMLLLYFASMTAIGAPPEYRYRMILEPMLIVAVAYLLLIVGQEVLARIVPGAIANAPAAQ
jgi:hypothetical protein